MDELHYVPIDEQAEALRALLQQLTEQDRAAITAGDNEDPMPVIDVRE